MHHHSAALRASLHAVYGIDLRTELARPEAHMLDLADKVAWLPSGSALWVSIGGPSSITSETDLLRWVDFEIRRLVWLNSEDGKQGRNRPEPPPKPAYAHERSEQARAADSKSSAWARRQAIRAGQGAPPT